MQRSWWLVAMLVAVLCGGALGVACNGSHANANHASPSGNEQASASPAPTSSAPPPTSSAPPPQGHECRTDADCRPATCCHPTACVPRDRAPSCDEVNCTEDCRPATLDCGGGCGCENGSCVAHLFRPHL